MKKICAAFMAIAVSLCLICPAFASSDTEYIAKDTFWNWAADNTDGLLSTIISYVFDDVCTVNEDGHHRASTNLGHTTWFGTETPYYLCICDACGQEFTAYETDLQQSYDDYVADLPAPVYGADGSIYIVPTIFEIRHVDESTVHGVLSNGEIKESYGGDYRISVNLPLIRFERLKRYYNTKSSCTYGVEVSYETPFVCTFEVLFSSATYSTNNQSGQLSFETGSSYYSGGVKYYEAGKKVYVRLVASNLSMIKEGYYDVPGNYVYFFLSDLRFKITPVFPLSDTYDITTRPTSITGGNYGIIGDNGQITTVTNNNQIVNETNNIYYNPATGETSTITDWSYDYSDRSYNLTLEGGDTSTVTYGDENITITETTINESGDTIINNYTIYYIIDGSGAGTDPVNPPTACTHNWQEGNATAPTCTRPGSASYVCSLCNQTKTETIPALGHNWQVKQTVTTQYDDTGQLIQQGYTIFECSVCHEQYKSQDGTIPPGGSSGNGSGDEGEEKEGFLSWLLRKAGELLGAVGNGIIGFLQSILDGIFDGLISLVNSVFENLAQVVDLFGSFGDALGVLWTWLPPEIMVILVAGVSVFVLIALLKLFMK